MSIPTSSRNFQRFAVLLIVLLLWLVKSVWREDQWILFGNKAVNEQHPRRADFAHFLVHIPKSGGSFAFDKLVETLVGSSAWQSLDPKNRSMICDGRTRPTEQFETHYPYTSRQKKYARYPCNFWMAEQPYTELAKSNYIIVRSPRAHILSQYFHCKESINHYDRWRFMPSLDDWLEAWVDAMDNQTQADLNSKFHCFDPRNLQSRFAGTLIKVQSNSNITLPTVPELVTQLEKQFVVVGDNARMHPSVCMIFIKYTGGWIPPQCNCTQNVEEQDDARRRNLKIHLYGHGVRHHGSTYPTTEKQDKLLQRLMDQDEHLYEAVQRLYIKQMDAIQREYGIQICEQ